MKPTDPVHWDGAVSLEDRVVAIFERKETQLDEFQTYLKIFGRERLEKIWKDYREKRK